MMDKLDQFLAYLKHERHALPNTIISYKRDLRDKEENLKKAIQAFEEALKIRTIERYPVDYVTTKNNLGNAYSNLFYVRGKEDDLDKAIHAFEEALQVFKIENFPLLHGQINLKLEYTKKIKKMRQ